MNNKLSHSLPAILCFLFLFGYQALVFLPLSGNEFFCEGGLNFFYHARFSPFFTALFTLDMNYLPLFQRIVAFGIHSFSTLDALAPLIQSVTALLLGSLFCASICLPFFESPTFPLTWRLFLALVVGMNADLDLHYYINFIYLAALPLLFTAMRIGERGISDGTTRWVVGVGVAVLFLSKSAFIAYFPIFLILLWNEYREQRPFGWLIMGLSGGLLQVAIQAANLGVLKAGPPKSLLFFASRSFLSSIDAFLFVLSGRLWLETGFAGTLSAWRTHGLSLWQGLGLAIVVLFLGGLIRHLTGRRADQGKLFFLFVIALGVTWTTRMMILAVVGYTVKDGRWAILANIALLTLLIYLLADAAQSVSRWARSASVLGVSLVLFYSGPFFLRTPQSPGFPELHFSQWTEFVRAFERRGEPLPSSFCIGVNPYEGRYWIQHNSRLGTHPSAADLLNASETELAPGQALEWLPTEARINTVLVWVSPLRQANDLRLFAVNAQGLASASWTSYGGETSGNFIGFHRSSVEEITAKLRLQNISNQTLRIRTNENRPVVLTCVGL